MLATDRASINKLPCVLVQGCPPEPPVLKLLGTLDPRMAGEVCAMGPLENLRVQSNGDKEPVGGTGTGPRLVLQGSLNSLLHSLGQSSEHVGRLKDSI